MDYEKCEGVFKVAVLAIVMVFDQSVWVSILHLGPRENWSPVHFTASNSWLYPHVYVNVDQTLERTELMGELAIFSIRKGIEASTRVISDVVTWPIQKTLVTWPAILVLTCALEPSTVLIADWGQKTQMMSRKIWSKWCFFIYESKHFMMEKCNESIQEFVKS